MSGVDPLLGNDPTAEAPKPLCKRMCSSCGTCSKKLAGQGRVRVGCAVCWSICGVCFVLAWMLQGLLYWVWTMNCNSGNLKGYSYPGGGTSALGGGAYNLVPKIALLRERVPQWYGTAFDVIPSNAASTISEAPVGSAWKMWGPIFDTYVYQDVQNSQETIYMRRNLFRIGMSHRICRCDGQGPEIWIEEGSNWFTNMVRHGFGMSQAVTFKLYVNDDFVATVEETNYGMPSITFVTVAKKLADKHELASSILKNPLSKTPYNDEWLVSNFKTTTLPYWVPTMSTVIFAFAMIGTDRTKGGHTAKAAFLVNATAMTFEEEPLASMIEEEE